jgi:hypothetical protein
MEKGSKISFKRCFSTSSKPLKKPFLYHNPRGSLIQKRVYTTLNITPLNKKNRPENLALEHINSGNTTTSTVINNILSNQKVTITEKKLVELLSVKGVEFDLPITKETEASFTATVGKSKHSRGFAGIYIFTHIASGSKYVGSSNLLARRMDYYFKDNLPQVGLFFPLLTRDGLSAFKLKIYKLDKHQFQDIDALFLEQYHLLDKKYEINTLRVVNFGPSLGKPIYIYDISATTLYYHAQSRISLKRKLGIAPSSCAKYVDTKIPYLGLFILLSFPILTADPSNLSEAEFLD